MSQLFEHIASETGARTFLFCCETGKLLSIKTFSRFLNCAHGTKSCNAPHLLYLRAEMQLILGIVVTRKVSDRNVYRTSRQRN